MMAARLAVALLVLFVLRNPAEAQSEPGTGNGEPSRQTPASDPPNYSESPQPFPRLYQIYRPQNVPDPDLKNSPGLSQSAGTGKMDLSLPQLLAAVVENNLDLAAARYTISMSETDVLRARSGQAPRGVEGVPIPSGLFAGAIGAGLGGGARGGGGGGGGGGITGSARVVSIGSRGSFDPSLSLNFSLDNTASPLNTLRVAGVPFVTGHTTSLQIGYAQAFTSGTSFSLSWNTERDTSTQRFLLFNPALSSRLNLAVNQPLLNGFGFAVNRRFQKVAERNRGIARDAFRQQAILTLSNAQNLYWDFVASREQARAAEQALAVAERLRQDNEKQARIGTLAPLDVVAAEAEVAARRRDLIAAQTNQQLKEVQLKNVMSKELDAALGAARIEPTDLLPLPKDSDIPSFDEALAAAMRDRPEIARAEGGILNQQVVTQFTRDSLKPSLSVFGQLISASRAGDLGGALGQLKSFRFPDYAFGFTLAIPLLNRSAQADDLRARLDLRQAETALQRTRNQIRLEVRNALIALLQAKAQTGSARKALELSRRTLEAEEKRLQAGVSTPYNVIQKQRDFESAQFAEVAARSSYAKARVALDQATGVTLEKNQIPLDNVLRGKS